MVKISFLSVAAIPSLSALRRLESLPQMAGDVDNNCAASHTVIESEGRANAQRSVFVKLFLLIVALGRRQKRRSYRFSIKEMSCVAHT